MYGNASSIHHFGQAAKQRLEPRAAAWPRCSDREPSRKSSFTSGGTEADNLAILGAVHAARRPARHVITSAIEHPAVLNACAQLEREGAAVTICPSAPRESSIPMTSGARCAPTPF